MTTILTRNFYKTTYGKRLFGVPIFLFTFILFSQQVQSQVVHALTSAGNLITFSPLSPGTIISTKPLTGIAAGQVVEGMDFRPATGQLFALGYVSASGQTQVYSINPNTGVALPIGSAITLAAGMSKIGFDFNPTVDRIRVTSSTGQSYRLNPNDGTLTAMDGSLAYAVGDPRNGQTPNVQAVAYTNSFPGSTTTTLFAYDATYNGLLTINPPNNGTLNTVGPSGITASSATGIDLDITTNTATSTNTAYFTAGTTSSNNNFYNLNLTTGAVTLIGSIGLGISVVEMAISLPPAPVRRLIYGLSGNNLISFNSNAPGTILSNVAITGITSGQAIEGLDFRPATGQLFAIGYNATNGQTQLYTINLTSAVATAVGSALTLPTGMSKLGFDFNPTVDRIRLTSSTRQSFRLNPNDGTLSATDGTLTYAPGDPQSSTTPNVQTVAYTNSFSGSTTTTLYAYDYAVNNLVIINPPNNGTLNTVGSSGLMPNAAAGLDMDISTNQSSGNNTAFLTAGTTASSNNLYVVDLATGFAENIGLIGTGLIVNDIAVALVTPVISRVVYGISAGNLITFNSNTPGTITSSVPLTGIVSGQTVEGLDFRPLNNQLIALGYNSSTGLAQVYNVNTATGVATAIGTGATLATGMTKLGVDFNPTVDRIRVTGNGGQNYRLNPVDGTLSATDASLAYAAGDPRAGTSPNIQGVAYTNSFTGSTTTTLYGYDVNGNNLVIINPPNNGTLNTVGSSGIIANTSSTLDFDILANQSELTNSGFLSAGTSSSMNNFYTIDLTTGYAELVGQIGSGLVVTEIAVSNVNAALPVTLTEFTVVKEGATSRLAWRTQAEINNDYFIIERSSDGRNFSSISGKVFSKAIDGNSNTVLSYGAVDALPLKGKNFYRLMQVDKDRNAKYSQVLQLSFDALIQVRLFPNPVRNILNIKGNFAGAGDLQVSIIDAGGKLISTYSYKNQQNDFNFQLPMGTLNPGLYHINILKNNAVVHSESVMKF